MGARERLEFGSPLAAWAVVAAAHRAAVAAALPSVVASLYELGGVRRALAISEGEAWVRELRLQASREGVDS